MNGTKTRKQYPPAITQETVEFLLRSNKSTTEIARDLGIRSERLYRRKREYLANKDHSFPGTGHLHSPEEERIRKLERELRSVTEERDILKKAVAIFSKTPK